jgi:hypothetical protein
MVADASGGSAGANTPQDDALERALDIASRDRSIRIPVETK